MLADDLVSYLKRQGVVVIVDPQVHHVSGKLRSLPLITKLLGEAELCCFRPQKIYAHLGTAKLFGEKAKATTCETKIAVASQAEEENRGLVEWSLHDHSVVAIVDRTDFIPKGSDRRLVASVGMSFSYPQIYSTYCKEERLVVPLSETKNLAFQQCAAEYVSKTPKSKIRLLDLFDWDDPNTAGFPWWDWPRGWAFQHKNSWFRHDPQTVIIRDVGAWIEDQKIAIKAADIFLGLMDSMKFEYATAKEWGREHAKKQ